ncbi:MAG: GPP34 family phosphoprotein, partial [Nitriliruptoraceae bacterium]
MGTTARREQVRDRLVSRGLLVPEERKVLGLFPVTRHRVAATQVVEPLADAVRDVLGGGRPA